MMTTKKEIREFEKPEGIEETLSALAAKEHGKTRKYKQVSEWPVERIRAALSSTNENYAEWCAAHDYYTEVKQVRHWIKLLDSKGLMVSLSKGSRR